MFECVCVFVCFRGQSHSPSNQTTSRSLSPTSRACDQAQTHSVSSDITFSAATPRPESNISLINSLMSTRVHGNLSIPSSTHTNRALMFMFVVSDTTMVISFLSSFKMRHFVCLFICQRSFRQQPGVCKFKVSHFIYKHAFKPKCYTDNCDKNKTTQTSP